MRLRSLAAAGVALTAFGASHLDAVALTSGASLPAGNGSSVVATGALASVPSPLAAVDAVVACINTFTGTVVPPTAAVNPAFVGPEQQPIVCIEAGLAMASGPTVTVSGTWVGVTSSISGGSLVATVTCQVSASTGFPFTDEPLTTSVDDCYLLGANGVQYMSQSRTLPGAAAAVDAVSLSVPVQPYQVCVVGSASYLGGSAPSAGACQ